MCDFVFFNLDPDTKSLDSHAPGLAQDIQERAPELGNLRGIDSLTFGPTIAANWKVVVDNFLECYHCAPAHPDFASLIDMSSYQMETFSNWSRQLGPDTRPDNTAYPFDSDAPVQSAAFWYLWPTTSIGMFPGSPNLIVLSILPLGHRKTSFSGYQYALDIDQDDDMRQQYQVDVLSPPDVALCESVQRGLKSRSYDQGRFMVDSDTSGIAEHAVHQFHRLVLSALGSDGY